MRVGILIAAKLSILYAATAADIPRESGEPTYFGAINELTSRLKWRSLRDNPLSADSLEVRIWIGFGVVPLEGFRLQRNGDHWSAQHVVDRVPRSKRLKVYSVAPKSSWNSLWQKLADLRLLTLPDSSALPRDERIIMDGESYVVEIKEGGGYRTYEYSNPQFRALPEAKQMVEIVQTLHRELESR